MNNSVSTYSSEICAFPSSVIFYYSASVSELVCDDVRVLDDDCVSRNGDAMPATEMNATLIGIDRLLRDTRTERPSVKYN